MANGDIGAIIDTLEFDVADIAAPSLVHVTGDIYVIAYENATGDGEMATVEIDSAGQIGAAVIDSLVFDAVDGHEVKIIHVSGTIFAVAYRGVDADGFLVTVEITAAGQIGAAVIDSLEFDTSACYDTEIIKITDSVVAVVYRDATNQGKIITASIDASGNIGATVLDAKNAWAANCNCPEVVGVSDDIYAVVYRDNLYKGHVCTVDIAANGQIGAAVIDSLMFDAVFAGCGSICHVKNDTFAIAYLGVDDDGFLVTVEIDAAGQIGAAVIDSLEFDTTHGVKPNIILLNLGIVAIAYQGAGDDGFLVTAQIEADGQIGAAVIDSLEFDGVNGVNPELVRVSGNTYAIAYQGLANDGFLVTISIETPPLGGVKHLLMVGVG